MMRAIDQIGSLARSPVRGGELAVAQAVLRREGDDVTCLFCSERCRMPFALRRTSFVTAGLRTGSKEATGR